MLTVPEGVISAVGKVFTVTTIEFEVAFFPQLFFTVNVYVPLDLAV
jgi:hypothetical protein